MWVQSLGREDPLDQEMATHSGILVGKSHGQKDLAVYGLLVLLLLSRFSYVRLCATP